MERTIITGQISYIKASDNPLSADVVIVEEFIVEEKPQRHHEHHKHYDRPDHHKDKHHGKHHGRKVVILNEWDGVIIDCGAATECCCPASCK